LKLSVGEKFNSLIGFLFTPQLLAYATAGVAWSRLNVKQATTFVQGRGLLAVM